MADPRRVAPHAGAWIEICTSNHNLAAGGSLPMRERGLKFIPLRCKTVLMLSLPMRERGLKFWFDQHSTELQGRSPCGSVD